MVKTLITKEQALASRDFFRDAAEAGITSALSKTLGKTYGLLLSSNKFKDSALEEPPLGPPEFLLPDDALLEQFLKGQWPLEGGRVTLSAGSPFEATAPSPAWAEALNGFGWLVHFTARQDEETQRHVRWLVTTWVRTHHKYDGLAWEPHVIGRRLTAWLCHWRLIAKDAEADWKRTVLLNMAKQAAHLSHTLHTAPAGADRIYAAAGLIHTGLCLLGDRQSVERGLEQLDQEMKRQVLADGGHVSRCPQTLLEIIIVLQQIREVCQAAGQRLPVGLQNALDRMEAMIDFFRHGDGALALFNGSTEGPELNGDPRLAYDPTREGHFAHARHSGFQRVRAGQTLLLADGGQAPPPRYGNEAHAGCLSFELSSGPNRLIVNCGTIRIMGPEWRAATRQTVAHSTATVADHSSTIPLEGGLPGKLLGGTALDGPKEVKSQRHESEDGVLLELAHNGYANRFNIRHERRLFLNSIGQDMRGEDKFLLQEPDQPAGEARDFAVRFHLHPDCRAVPDARNNAIALLLPRGEQWRFRAMGGDITLEDSVYLGRGTHVENTQQIVMRQSGSIGPDTPITFKWKFLRTD